MASNFVAKTGSSFLFKALKSLSPVASSPLSAVAAASASRRGFATPAAANDETPIEMKLPIAFKAHELEPPTTEVITTPKELIKFFQEMFEMRRMEIACDILYKGKMIRGFCHLYDGQEAISVGMEAAINFDDCIVTSYRDHCIQLARGGSVSEVVGELMGKATGCSRGKGGSMHMFKPENNFYGGQAIVGAQTPLGTGFAFTTKYLNKPNVGVAMYGDGAANQGQLFEAMNIAGLWKLPVIYLCENNHYGMGTAEWRSSKSHDYYKRGHYIPGIKCDGMDVLAVKQVMKFAKHYALTNGPLVVEMDTYRYHGHSMSDPGSSYRTREEIAGVRQERDPVERVRKLLLEKQICSPPEIKAMEKDIKAHVDSEVEKAKKAAVPDLSIIYEDVYVDYKGFPIYGVDRKHETRVFT